ncbi:MAG: M36 family metallopeptidase [Proteobacteria bacterium]|nr:M36 family metallopeptidase [Pseudomonadota bacterium]
MKLADIMKNARIQYDAKTTIPRKIDCRVAVSPGDTPEKGALALLTELGGTLRLSTDKKDLQVTQSKTTSTGSYVRFQQYIDGMQVVGGEVVVHIDKAGFVRRINAGHQPRESVITTAKEEKIAAAEAEKIMRRAVGENFTIRPKGKLSTERVYFRTAEGLRLAWLVIANTLQPPHDWFVYVDAENGAVLALEDHIMLVDGQGMVFNPNPVVVLNDNTIREGTTPEATLNGTRQTVVLRDITGPVGGNYTLSGPFCNIVNLANPNIGIPQESSATGFNYTRTDDNFEAVNVYYHIDSLQRYIQDTLGINDANNRAIDADPHDNSMNAAWYSPSTKDLHFSDSGPTQPDRAEDSDCMAHEYSHAIQDDMVPGWGSPVAGTTRYESRAIGEGFGDMTAVLYNILHGNGYQRQVMEDWVFVNNNLGDGLRGLRRVDHDKLYSAFVAGQIIPGTTQYTFYPNSEIWSGALWNIFLTMGGDSPTVADWEEPRDILLKTIIASNRLLTTSASMPEAAEALMNTHEELEDQCGRQLVPMIDEFHDREILECQAGSDIRLTSLWSQQDNSSIRSREQVEFGQDNWFYAVITNQGTMAARSLVVNFSFKSPFSTPVYPADFRNNIISGVAEFDLAPGETRTIWGRWDKDLIPVIPAGQTSLHGCILAEIYNPVDHVAAGVTSIGASNGKLRQRNTDVVDLVPGDSADFHFTISNFHLKYEELVRLEIIRPDRWPGLAVSFSHHNEYVISELLQQARELAVQRVSVQEEMLAVQQPSVRFLQAARIEVASATLGEQIVLDLAPDSTMMLKQTAVSSQSATSQGEFSRCDAVAVKQEQGSVLMLKPGIRTGFVYTMKPHQRRTLKVTVQAPADAKPGEEFTVEFVQRNAKGEFIGGFDVLVRVVEKKKTPVIVKPPVIREKIEVKVKTTPTVKKTTATAKKPVARKS